MERIPKGYKASRVIAIVFAAAGFLVVFINEILLQFLGNNLTLKFSIILFTAISAYHAFLSSVIRSIVESEVRTTQYSIETKIQENNKSIKAVDTKVGVLKDSIPYSDLDEIEYKHGHANKDVKCEVWVIANMLQEAKSDDTMLSTIYENITRNNISYYYILPKNDNSICEISGLKNRLNKIHKEKKDTITGTINYRYDNNLLNIITSDYFDIVLYIDFDDDGKPYIFKGDRNMSCEGFQCFSPISENNDYYYQSINQDTITRIRSFHLKNKKFEKMEIGA